MLAEVFCGSPTDCGLGDWTVLSWMTQTRREKNNRRQPDLSLSRAASIDWLPRLSFTPFVTESQPARTGAPLRYRTFFDMYFFKRFYGVFELSLLRNAQKRHLKKRVSTYLPHLVTICQMYVAFISPPPFSAPCARRPRAKRQ
jgi:hypothetical protein